jgi:hypothetical protein
VGLQETQETAWAGYGPQSQQPCVQVCSTHVVVWCEPAEDGHGSTARMLQECRRRAIMNKHAVVSASCVFEATPDAAKGSFQGGTAPSTQVLV